MKTDFTFEIEELINIMRNDGRADEQECEMIRKAYGLAAEAHASQRRKSGEAYIMHPVAVARIVGMEFGLGANPVIAALLHDVVEDTPYTLEDIREMFGDDVAFIVDVVTKRPKDSYQFSKQVDNYRQLLASLNYDIRALIVKISDRLHNMRTLSSMPPAKQVKIASETAIFYAPLACRLGLYKAKCELQDLSLKYRNPQEYEELASLVGEYIQDKKKTAEELRDQFARVVPGELPECRVIRQNRSVSSMYRLMQKHNSDFRHVMSDVFYFDVVVDADDVNAKRQILNVYAAITGCFNEIPHSVVNYMDHAKENGYRSFHFRVMTEQFGPVEIHVSTTEMYYQSLRGCVASRDNDNVQAWIETFRTNLKELSADNDFFGTLMSKFYNDDITVLTPKGERITLPQNATALDFAFEIHTSLGLKAKYCKINGTLHSVKTRLNRGDVVEIGTGEDVHPRQDWLGYVVSYRSKKALGSYLQRNGLKSADSICQDCCPIPGEDVIGIRDAKGNVTIHRRSCPHVLNVASQHGDSIIAVELQPSELVTYPVGFTMVSVDRYHLLSDIISCITDSLQLTLSSISSDTKDEIVTTKIRVDVHSRTDVDKLHCLLSQIEGVDSVMIG